MAEKQKKKKKKNRKQAIKQFLKKNMTPTWAKRFSYQVVAFLISVAMVSGVALYAFNKSYDERTLRLVDDFTITAHTGAFDTPDNTIESLQVALDKGVKFFEIDIRMRPNGTIVMGHDLINLNSDGVEVEEAFKIAKGKDIKLNLDIKEIRTLKGLYQLILKYNIQDQVFLTGIESFQAKKVQAECPNIQYYINYKPSRIRIFSADYQQRILDMLEETGAVGINCKHIYCSSTLSGLLHNNGYLLSIWTVDKKYQMKRLLVSSPDNITTHNPIFIQELIDNWGK